MGSSCSTPWLLYNEGLLLVTGLQQTGGNGFCHERSHCMKSTERNFYSRSPRCLFSNPDKFYRHDCGFLILNQFGLGCFSVFWKYFFYHFENENNHVYDTVLTSNWGFFFVISIWIDEYLFVGFNRNVIVFVL